MRRLAVGASITALVLIAVVSIITAASFAEKKALAEAQQAQAQAEGARSAYLRGDSISARAQLRSSLQIADSSLVRSLWSTLKADPVEWRKVMPAILYDIASSPDGAQIAVAAQDESVYLVDRFTGETRTLRAHEDQVIGIAFSTDGRLLASCDMAGKLVIWNLAQETHVVIAAHTAVAWKVAFSPDSTRVVSASWDGTARIWNAQTGQALLTIRTGGATHRALFDRTGKRLILGSSAGQVRVHDVTNGELLAQQSVHEGPVTSLVLSEDGHTLVSGSEAKTIAVMQSDDGVAWRILKRWVAHELAVTDLELSRKDTVISVSYDGRAKRWNLATGQLQASFPVHSSAVVGIAALPDDKWASAGYGDKSIVVWDARDTAENNKTVGHTEPVEAVLFSPDGRTIYSAADDKLVRAWDVDTGREVRQFAGATDGIHALDLSADGKRLITGSFDAVARIYDTETGTLTRELRAHENGIIAALFQEAGQQVVTVSNDAVVHTWSTQTGALTSTGRLPIAPHGAGKGRDRVVFTSVDDGHIVYSLSDKRVIGGSKSGGFGAALAPDDSFYILGRMDGVSERYTSSAKLLSSTKLSERRTGRGDITHDGLTAGFGFADGGRIWPVAQAESAVKIAGHFSEVCDLKFDASGKRFATAGHDGTVRAWDTQTRAPLWYTRAVLHDEQALATHTGWRCFTDEDCSALKSAAASSAVSVATNARWFESAQGVTCAITADGRLLAWNGKTPESPVAAPGVTGVTRTHPAGDGCVALAGERAIFAKLSTSSIDVRLLADQANDIAVGDGAFVVLNGKETLVFSSSTGAPETFSSGKIPSAAGVASHHVFIGFADGGVEIIDRTTRVRRSFSGELQPSGAVRFLRGGPGDTLFIGYGSGATGLWSLSNGTSLQQVKMHGECIAMLPTQNEVRAISSLGNVATFDLSSFKGSLCTVRNDVTSHIGIIWEDGKPVRRAAQVRACD